MGEIYHLKTTSDAKYSKHFKNGHKLTQLSYIICIYWKVTPIPPHPVHKAQELNKHRHPVKSIGLITSEVQPELPSADIWGHWTPWPGAWGWSAGSRSQGSQPGPQAGRRTVWRRSMVKDLPGWRWIRGHFCFVINLLKNPSIWFISLEHVRTSE